MTLRLATVPVDSDLDALAASLAPGFGGDPDAGREVLGQTLALLAADPRADPWGCYLAHAGDAVVGFCAFKAAPDAAGTVEIAYMTFPAFERHGHATAMVAALLRVANPAGAPLVIAHTLPQENASTRALRRNSFVQVGETIDPEDGLVWRWEHGA